MISLDHPLRSQTTAISYSQLDQLLRNRQWREADQLTAKLMYQAMNRTQDGFLRIEDLERFPCEDPG